MRIHAFGNMRITENTRIPKSEHYGPILKLDPNMNERDRVTKTIHCL